MEISNRGDRGTTINEIEVNFEVEGKKYSLKKSQFRIPYGISRGYHLDEKRRWINPHETIEVLPDFSQELEIVEKDNIDCTFKIYHTHGSLNCETTSKIYHVGKL